MIAIPFLPQQKSGRTSNVGPHKLIVKYEIWLLNQSMDGT